MLSKKGGNRFLLVGASGVLNNFILKDPARRDGTAVGTDVVALFEINFEFGRVTLWVRAGIVCGFIGVALRDILLLFSKIIPLLQISLTYTPQRRITSLLLLMATAATAPATKKGLNLFGSGNRWSLWGSAGAEATDTENEDGDTTRTRKLPKKPVATTVSFCALFLGKFKN
jgi:hypothetical protein